MKFILKKFRELDTYELYEILKLRTEVFVVEQKCPYQEVDGLDLDSYHFIGRNNRGEICAYLRIPLKGISYEHVSIGRVLVSEKYRGKGYARELMLRALDIISNEMKEERVIISAQAYLEDFYNSFGFNPISDVYLEDGIEHIKMEYLNGQS